jgi:Arc/MetJ family transcription regulator
VIDNLKGTGRNSYDLYWHLSPDATGNVRIENEGIATTDLVLASSLPHSALTIEKSAVSYAYREKVDAPVIRYSFTGDGEATVMTVLHPRSDAAESVRLKSPGNIGFGVFEIKRMSGTDVLALSGGSPSIASAGIETDAELVFLRRSNKQSVERILALNGSYLRFEGKTLFDSFGRKIDISSAGTRVTAKGANISKLTVRLPGVLELVLNGEQTKTVMQNGLMIFD